MVITGGGGNAVIRKIISRLVYSPLSIASFLTNSPQTQCSHLCMDGTAANILLNISNKWGWLCKGAPESRKLTDDTVNPGSGIAPLDDPDLIWISATEWERSWCYPADRTMHLMGVITLPYYPLFTLYLEHLQTTREMSHKSRSANKLSIWTKLLRKIRTSQSNAAAPNGWKVNHRSREDAVSSQTGRKGLFFS